MLNTRLFFFATLIGFSQFCQVLWESSTWWSQWACLAPVYMEVTRSKNKTRLHAILLPRGAGVRFLEVVVALSSKELEQRRPKLTSQKDERLTLGHICVYSWKCHALCYAVFGFARNRWLNTLYGIVWETKYGRFITLNIPKCVIFTLISVVRRLGNVQSFNTYMFRFWASCHERDPG